MNIIHEPERLRQVSREAREAGRTIGLVPTMGYLHEGHASLLREARRRCGFVIASIFVNPTQFGPGEDLDRYPRDFERDRSLLERLEVDVLFHPEAGDLYPAGPPYRTWVAVEGLSERLCGASRPGHFRGVATIVLKLINLARPDVVFFGQKDAQQAVVIRTMVRDLNVGALVEVLPTVREPDGLALSSRNAYLGEAGRAAAPVLYRALVAAREAFDAGERSPEALLAKARGILAAEPLFRLEYLELVDDERLEPTTGPRPGAGVGLLLAVAGHIGTTRLIDNIPLEWEKGTREGQDPC